MSASESLPSSYKNSHEDITGISIAFVLCQDFEFQCFSGFVNVLDQLKTEYSDTDLKEISWSVVGERNKPIRSSCNIDVLPRSGFNQPERYDYVVIIGGLTQTLFIWLINITSPWLASPQVVMCWQARAFLMGESVRSMPCAN